MACVTEQNLCWEEGKDDTLTVTITYEDTGLPLDITGYTVYFTVKVNKNDADVDAIISKDVSSFADPTNGIAVITIDRADTLNKNGTYFYDIQMDDTTPHRTPVIKGKFVIEQGVTER